MDPGKASMDPIKLEEAYGAHNYSPLPVVISRGEGVWVTDTAGRRYLDMLAAYSALNFGHRHPRLVAAAKAQLDRLTLTSRAFHNDQLGLFCQDLAECAGMEAVLPMNTGAEAVETGVKLARRWGYDVKGVAPGRAKIVVCDGNFHGRTTTIISFSTDESARRGFGPYTPGFEVVRYGDADALRAAIDEDTVAFLVEPVQGEAGVIVPPDGYLGAARRICSDAGILLVADEIQTGLGRTGALFACEHEGVTPDVYLLGKALGGGILPLSAVVARWDVMGVVAPGEHGSTFGGNPLAAAVGREVLALLREERLHERAAALGRHLLDRLAGAHLPGVTQIRGRGLWTGIDLAPGGPTARRQCEQLAARGVLAKDTHARTIRLAPPLIITEDELDWAVERLAGVLAGTVDAGRP